MRAEEFENPKDNFVEMFRKFLPLAMKVLELKSLPEFEFHGDIDSGPQPSFGMYSVDETKLYVALSNRHPNDILRTIAHELVHYKQDTEHKLNDESGSTGSPEENQANALAGVVMRNFNKQYPEYLKTKPIVSHGAKVQQGMTEDEMLDEGIMDFISKAKDKFLRLKDALSDEWAQSKEMWKIVQKGDMANPKEISFANSQFKDILRVVGLAAWYSLPIPGNTLLILTTEKLLNKVGMSIIPDKIRNQVLNVKNPNVAEDNATQYVAALYVDEFADGDHWYIKGTPDVIQRFVQLANSLEDEAVKGTEYEPGVGMMAKIHKDLGDDSIPQWKIVSATNLEQIKPITGASLKALMTADLSDGAGEFMSEFLWNLEEKGQALVHDGSEQSVSENFDKEAEAWKKWQVDHLDRKMEMLSRLVKKDEWLPSKDDHYTAIEAGYNAMIKTGNVNDAAKAISDTFKEIQRQQGVLESDGHPKSFTNNGLTWTLEHLGSIDGKDLGSGGLIDIFKGYQDINNKGKFRWFIRGQRTGVLRPVSSEHTAIRKFLHPNIANNDEYKKFTEQGVTEGSYREGGSITHDGVEYDFDRVMSIAEKLPAKTCSVDKLSWILKYDTPNKERLERADITVPLIVTKSSNEKLAAIDGLHRLAKAVRDNVKTVKVKYIKPSDLESARLNQQGVTENFADGRNPQDKGDSARHGIRKGMTIAQLKKVRSSDTASPRKKQLAHWQINMRQGRKK